MLLKSLYRHFLVYNSFLLVMLALPLLPWVLLLVVALRSGWRCAGVSVGCQCQESITVWNSTFGLMVPSSSPQDVLGVFFYVFADTRLDLYLSSLACSSVGIQIYCVVPFLCITYYVFVPPPSPPTNSFLQLHIDISLTDRWRGVCSCEVPSAGLCPVSYQPVPALLCVASYVSACRSPSCRDTGLCFIALRQHYGARSASFHVERLLTAAGYMELWWYLVTIHTSEADQPQTPGCVGKSWSQPNRAGQSRKRVKESSGRAIVSAEAVQTQRRACSTSLAVAVLCCRSTQWL